MQNRWVQYLKRSSLLTTAFACLALGAHPVFAAETLGDMATLITGSFTSITQLITAVSYIAGLAFFISAILKFKEHKEMPSQTPIGKPVSQTLIAAALVFLPSLISTIGYTGFHAPVTAGPTGMVYTTP